MTYKASLDGTARTITLIISAIVPFIIIFQLVLLPGAYLVTIITAIFLASLFLIVYGYRSTGYTVTKEQLVINRPFKNKVIDRADIESVAAVDANDIGTLIRIIGVGGFCGYYGEFSSRKLGKVKLYATRRDRMVLIKMNNSTKLLLSPDEPESLVAALQFN